MTEFIRNCPPPEQVDFGPQGGILPTSKFYDCAYGPITAPHGPAYDSGWRTCPPGGTLQELPMSGGGWNKFPSADKLLPLPNDFPMMKGCPNEYIGYARSGGLQDCIAKSRGGGGGYLTGINRAIEDGVPIARTLKNRGR